MSAYVLTSRAHGSPARFPSGSPRSSYSPNHSHAHCPLCCYVFTVCLKNSALSNSLLYIKSELSFVVPSKTSATNTHTAHFTADPTSRYLAKISLCMWLTWEASQSWSQTLFFFFKRANPPPLSSTATLVRALGRRGFAVSITCAVKPIALLALCDFGRVCKFGALHCKSCPETDILQGLSLPPHPFMHLTNENICHFLTSWCKR